MGVRYQSKYVKYTICVRKNDKMYFVNATLHNPYIIRYTMNATQTSSHGWHTGFEQDINVRGKNTTYTYARTYVLCYIVCVYKYICKYCSTCSGEVIVWDITKEMELKILEYTIHSAHTYIGWPSKIYPFGISLVLIKVV